MNKVKASAITVVVLVLLVAGLRYVEKANGRQGAETSEPAERSTAHDAQTGLVTLSPAEQRNADLATVSLKEVSERRTIQGAATVLPLQDLIDLRNSLVIAKTKLEKSSANSNASRKEYERLQKLFRDNQNVSEKSVQTAEASFRSDEAELQSAKQEVELLSSSARQRWGPVIADWLIRDNAQFDGLLSQRTSLVQISLPVGGSTAAPSTASLRTQDNRNLKAHLVSAYPRVDPRLQAPTYLYSVAADPTIVAGLNLPALLGIGEKLKGTVIPESAVVWWQGKAWVYEQTEVKKFVRREVSTEMPVAGGWFVSNQFMPGERIVMRGAQLLLSQEFRSQIQVLEEGEEKEKSKGEGEPR